MLHGVTQETMDLMKAALKSGTADLRKDVTTSTGLTYYDLQAPAKNLYPTITMLRNSTPRVGRPGGYGTAAHWKQITALTGSGFDGMGWIPEGQRSARMSYSAVDKSASYVTIGEEDSISFEAEAAAQGFEDVNATASMRLLQKTMRKEEIGLLGGNRSLSLGTPTAPTLSAAGSGATLPAATYSVIVVALTMEGYVNCAGSAANGFTPSQTITGADGDTYTLNGGNSNQSNATTQAVTLGQTLSCTVPVVTGAVAYAWFVGTSGNETLQSITTINSATFSAALAGSRQAATTVTADNSANASLAFDGFLTNAFSNGKITSLATGTAGTGTALTGSGQGSITEIDDMLQLLWDSYRTGPTKIYVSSQEQRNITKKILSDSPASTLRQTVVVGQEGKPFGVVANGAVTAYYNPFVGEGGQNIPVVAHPDLAPGTIYLHTERLPEWYQSNETPNVAEVITRRDYHRVDWPLKTRKREFGVYAEEVLACYAPFLLAVINNIANG